MINNLNTFKRYEKKYLLTNKQYSQFLDEIEEHTVHDQYYKYTICNVYFDTDSYEIIRRSIEKPIYKEKLRVRSYGTPGSEDKIFFELKKKYKKEVFKRRVSMSVQEFNSYLETNQVPDVEPQIMNEIAYFLEMYKPDPKVYIAYERTALKGKNDNHIRITFDENIRFRNQELSLSDGDVGTMILENNQALMEIKVEGAMPLWLSNALNKLDIYPTSFSKYGYCYKNYIANQNFRTV